MSGEKSVAGITVSKGMVGRQSLLKASSSSLRDSRFCFRKLKEAGLGCIIEMEVYIPGKLFLLYRGSLFC